MSVVDDPDSPAVIEDPYPYYRHLRDHHPVARTEQGTYLITRFADVQAVVSDWSRFSSQTTADNHDHVASMDPPRHDDHRASVARLFTPRRAGELEHHIRAMCEDILTPLVAGGGFDLAAELAAVLPSQVITTIVGVPEALGEQFRDRAIAIAHAIGTRGLHDAMVALQDLTWQAIDDGHDLPEGQILDTLLRAEDPDDPHSLSRREIVGLCTNLVLAGTDTATNLITTSVVEIDRRPELRAELAARPALLAGTIEEILRYDAPVQWLSRRSLEPVELHGTTIPAGSLLRVYWGSANRDERAFERSDELDVHREGHRHLAFGHGIHFCIGAALARLEVHIALEALLALDLRVDHDGAVRLPSSMFRGYEHLAVRTG